MKYYNSLLLQLFIFWNQYMIESSETESNTSLHNKRRNHSNHRVDFEAYFLTIFIAEKALFTVDVAGGPMPTSVA